MGSSQFGDILKDTRKRLGLTIDQATASTRIRGKILEAFEEADFLNMPPKGYSMNMLTSYARFLDLDPQDIVNLYVKEYDAFEEGHTFENDPYGYHGSVERVSTPQRSGTKSAAGRRGQGPTQRKGGLVREYRTYGADEPVAEPTHRTTQRVSNTRAGNNGGKNGRITRPSRIFSKNPRANFSTGGGLSPNIVKLILIGAAVVVLILLAVLIGSFVSSCSKSKSSDVTPVTNSTTANQMSNSTTSTTTPSTTPVTTTVPFTISFEIAEDNYSSMEVVIDGASAYSSGEAYGPMTQSFAVTKSVQMTIGSPDFVVVKKNGNLVDITKGADGIGHVDLSATTQTVAGTPTTTTGTTNNAATTTN